MKKIISLVFICCLWSAVAVAQQGAEDDAVFTKVETEAQFPGGANGFRFFLEKNLNANVPGRHHAPAGTYEVVVRFIVDRDGSLSEIEPETALGYGMEKEVVRVIKRSPKWIPAAQNGIVVRAYHRQPITFIVSNN